MDYFHIKKHLGEERLKKEIGIIEKAEWLNPERKRKQITRVIIRINLVP